MDEKEKIIDQAKALCEKFINKVETGRAQSRETYADCKSLLDNISKMPSHQIEESDFDKPESTKTPLFADALCILINKYSLENESDTPDFILAAFLESVLRAFNKAVRDREEWFDVEDLGDKLKIIEPLNEAIPPTWRQYKRKGISEMRPYIHGEDLTGVSVSSEDDPPNDMGMIARRTKNHNDQWYVARQYFDENFETA